MYTVVFSYVFLVAISQSNLDDHTPPFIPVLEQHMSPMKRDIEKLLFTILTNCYYNRVDRDKRPIESPQTPYTPTG
jgi:hypothetical protein